MARFLTWGTFALALTLAPPAAAQVQASFGAVIEPFGGNSMNDEFAVGATAGVRLWHRHTIEAQVLALPSQMRNETELTAAVASLTDPNLKEIWDGDAVVVARYRGSPFYGALPGTPVFIAVDLFVGGGLYAGTVELATIDYTTAKADVVTRIRSEPLPAWNVGGGVRVFPLPWLAIRWEMQVILGVDEVLDFSTPEAAQQNRNLPSDASRMLCGGAEARCTLAVEPLAVMGFGVDFLLPEVTP